jgi:hypothetical protein
MHDLDYFRQKEADMAFTPEDALKTRFEIVKSFGETAKNYIQISSAGLALPLFFTQAIFGKRADNGLIHIGSPGFLYVAWFCFLLAIGCGLVYQWLSVRRVWDDFHKMTWTEEKKDAPGHRVSKLILQTDDKMNLSYLYVGMVGFFSVGVVMFVWFAATTLRS